MRTSMVLMATLAVLVAAATGAADARDRTAERGPPAGGGAPSVVTSGMALVFASFDRDGDYATTRAEFEAGVARETAAAFGANAALSPIGFEAWAARALGGPAMGPFRFAFDANVDGQITKAEFASAFEAAFRKYDKVGDGRITRAEMVEPAPRMAPDGRGGPGRMRGGPPGGGPGDGPPGGPPGGPGVS